ncbi:hypothetical protein [Sphingomonas sp. MMS24-J13]|uniref:hypothetical protein n=1 Tax=Sphingomonas sp. MMS24-J13 TaxID=3238686 RepID=UPI00384B79A4
MNQLMRCHAARHAEDARASVLMAPGWIRTALGGPNAPFSVEEAVPKVVEVLLTQKGRPGLQFLDREGQPVPW